MKTKIFRRDMGTKKYDSKTGRQHPEPAKISNIIETFKSETFRFSFGAAVAVVSIFVILSYCSFLFNGGIDQSALTDMSDVANDTGTLGARLSQTIVNDWFGISSVLLPVMTLMVGVRLMGARNIRVVKWIISCIFLTVWLSVFLQLTTATLFKDSFIVPGGRHGCNIKALLVGYVGVPGLVLILGFAMLLYCIFVTRSTIEWIRERARAAGNGIGKIEKRGLSLFRKSVRHEGAGTSQTTATDNENENGDAGQTGPVVIDTGNDQTNPTVSYGMSPTRTQPGETSEPSPEPSPEPTNPKPEKTEIIDLGTVVSEGDKQPAAGKLQEPYDPRLDLSHYRFPTLDLLKHYDNDAPAIDEKEQIANKERIITVLRNFGIEIDSIQATVGPTITLYEITPAAGVRISKIRNLEADIALSLSALGIRIIAPIPGKGTIGIEVPNAKPVMVSMESILNTRKFAESKMELPVALGRTITNEVYMVDLVKMPHLLVAGATGQGKSVGLNCIITSLLYKKHPAELKLVMVDPKMVEFSIYAPIMHHFLAKLPDEDDAIITDTTKVIHTLKSLCVEMDNRYELLKEANVRSVIEYNDKFKARQLNPERGHRFLPYIVVVIDEFGDLIMTAGKDIEMPIARIAQKARAVGMHMIIATQRPTTNIITGTIKANFPGRMAFRVSSMIDSRTILDRPGANQLIGRGDMLFLSGSDPVRVQCAFVDTPEVNNICKYISSQQGYTEVYPLPEYVDENDAAAADSGVEIGKFDPLFVDAARLIVSTQSGSTSLIQRKFSIGYNRAGRLMDQLEKTGVVGRQDGSKPRPVLIMDDVQLDRLLESLNLL